MTLVPKMWKLATLPEEAVKLLLTTYVVEDEEVYRDERDAQERLKKAPKKADTDLFSMFGEVNPTAEVHQVEVQATQASVIWATDNYEAMGDDYSPTSKLHDLRQVKLRVEKSKEEQQRRVKQKAEVFTPSWVCNLQNNLIDDSLLGEGSFNVVSEDQKTWVSSERVHFTEDYPWWKYVAERRLEMCCGEAPYLFSSYDATTGDFLPVRSEDEEGELRWRRIGLLDRKLRVISENITKEKEWVHAARIALKSIYGYEWQGDNLVLARLNMVNAYFDHYRDFMVNTLGKSESTVKRHMTPEVLNEVAEIVSWQLWQMDGLKQVVPMSCSEECKACKEKKRHSHDGAHPVVKWGTALKPFEAFLLDNEE